MKAPPALGDVSVLDAMDDPEVFGPYFKGETWATWRIFIKALTAAPMKPAELEVYQHHTGRTAPPSAAFTGATAIVGRRGGKSRTFALLAVGAATLRDYTPYLAPGEKATIAVIAADRRQARSIFRYIAGMLDAVPALAEMIEDRTAESIVLSNQVVIEVATASWRVTRGYTFAAVLGDEVAFWRDDNSANPADEIIRAIRPGLATIPGALLLKGSSPYRRAGVLLNDYRRHWGKDDARVLVWKASTREMNPSIDPAIIDEAYEEDPASAAAEYGGEFRDDLADFVSRDVIDACTTPGRYELPRVVGVRYVAFADPSGGSSDSMTLAICHNEKGVAILDAVRERKAPFSPDSVVEEFAETLKAYGLSQVTGDRYAGAWPAERFKAHGIRYVPSEKPKNEIYLDMLPMLNSRQVELLDLPRMAAQFCGLERRTARGGKDSVDHAPKAHDDIANAVAGALLLANARKRVPMTISPEALAVARGAAGPPRLAPFSIGNHRG